MDYTNQADRGPEFEDIYRDDPDFFDQALQGTEFLWPYFNTHTDFNWFEPQHAFWQCQGALQALPWNHPAANFYRFLQEASLAIIEEIRDGS